MDATLTMIMLIEVLPRTVRCTIMSTDQCDIYIDQIHFEIDDIHIDIDGKNIDINGIDIDIKSTFQKGGRPLG